MVFKSRSIEQVKFDHSNISNVGGNQYNVTNNYLAEGGVLATLKPAIRSGNDVAGCMARTRESVFKEIDMWLEGDSGHLTFLERLSARWTSRETKPTPNILWISGSPGAGKSAIASTLVSNLTEQRRLGSFFFFKRGDANLGDPTVLWRTIAYDLARFHPSIESSVAQFLRAPGYRDTDIMLHFKCMIEDVLKSNAQKLSKFPPVIVIDALDECGCDDTHALQRRILLETLTRWAQLPQSFKLIVTSRDDRVPDSFLDGQICRKITLETGDHVSPETQMDIRIFFKQSFGNISPTLGLSHTWPGESAIDQLTERAAGLFIWAKTAMAFMEEKRGNPNTKLKLVLSGNLGNQSENVDLLYQQILDFSFRDAEDTTLELFKMTIGAIIVAKIPLYRHDLMHILHLLGRDKDEDDRQFNSILHSLSSVVELDGLLRLKHLSFAEFLRDPNRCHEPRFVVDIKEQHRNLTLACLRVLNADLRFNICRLESSHVRNDHVDNLTERIATFIPTRLLYSCRFWAAHLCGMTVRKEDRDLVLDEITRLFYVRFLYWLEVMSLINEIPTSSTALLTTADWLNTFDVRLSDFARDASRFIANFHIPISESAPHIYLSALPFSPTKSLISQRFLSQFPETLTVVAGRDDFWPALINVLTGHCGQVKSVACSPDGKMVIAGSSDRSLRMWNIETGQAVGSPFEGHIDHVLSVAFSPDGMHVASGSFDGAICVWDVETGQVVAGPFIGCEDRVMAVAYSPDGRKVVSGSSDEVRVWDVKTGRVVAGPFEGHTDRVTTVACSPDGKKVVSGSSDKTLRVWDIEIGQAVAGPFEGHIDGVHSVSYSPDGKSVVSGSSDGSLRVWNVETGDVVAGPFKGHIDEVRSVAYSPDGKKVVSGSSDRTLRVWDIQTGQVVAGPFEGHTYQVQSVVYSPDGKKVISGSADGTVRVWDIETGRTTDDSFLGQIYAVLSVAYSPDGKRVVSGSSDGMLHVWDIETGKVVAGPFEGHSDEVQSVAYSPDGMRVVSGSSDRTLLVWDVITGQVIAGPFKGHDDRVLSVAFLPDGKRVVSGSSDRTLRVWNIETGQAVADPFKGHTGWVRTIACSPNGKLVISGSSDRTLRVWDVDTGKEVATSYEGHVNMVRAVAFSPDGKQVVSGSSDRRLLLWDIETGQVVRGPYTHLDGVWSVAYSPDGKRVVSGSSDGTIRVWDIQTGQVVAGPFDGHIYAVLSVAYSPDGKWVVSGSADRTMRVWDIETSDASPTSSGSHLCNLHSIGGPDTFTSCCNETSCGWASSSTHSSSENPSLVFWVPPHARHGLCDGKSLFTLGARRTQVDLSRFAHGTSWARCHPRPCKKPL